MRSRVITIFAVSLFTVVLSGCGGTTTPNSNSGSTANGNTNNPLETTKATPEGTTNNAPTLTPVYKAYCAAMVKKDEAAIRAIYSSDTIKFFESQMKADNIKSLLKFLEDDQVSNEVCEVRNEQITGDTAIAEIRTKGYPNGIKVIFVKENGDWKITNKRPPGSIQ